MKRETRPFTVEVRRGAKKQSAGVLPSPPPAPSAEKTPMQRAEEILFSRDPAAAPKEGAPRWGRILEPVIEPVVVLESPEAEPPTAPRRRGRPPGSKNRPPSAGSDHKAPRGRPRLAPEVRQLKLTPELVTAAIESMTKLAPGQPSVSAPTTPFGRSRGFEEGGSAPIKRPRGRPRKNPISAPEERPIEAASTRANGGDSAGERPRSVAAQRSPSGGSGVAPAKASRSRLKRYDLNRLFKPGERWKARMRLRSLARRQRA